MITISPIYEKDADKAYREFFQAEFVSQRLGKSGQWHGEVAKVLGLTGPVTLAQFENLLNRRILDGVTRFTGESSNSHRERAWCLTINAPQSLTVLWALAPRQTRQRLEYTHDSAVEYSLWNLERAVSGWNWQRDDDPREQYPSALFAKFRCGTAWDQTPNLHTTVFLFNHAFHQDGTIGAFTLDQVRRQRFMMKETYEQMSDTMLWGDIGLYDRVPGVDLRMIRIPQTLCQKFFFDPTFSPQNSTSPGQPKVALSGEQLFARWQQQAEELGWGPKQAEQFLNSAQRSRRWVELVADCREKIHAGCRSAQRMKDSLKQLISFADTQSNKPGPDQSKDDSHSHSH